MENKNDIIMAIRNEGRTKEELDEETLPVSLSLFQLVFDHAAGDKDDELRVSFYKTQLLGTVSGVIAVPNKSHDLYCYGGCWPEVVRNDQPLLVITHSTAALTDQVMAKLPTLCANIYGQWPSNVIDVSHVLDVEDEAVMAQE